MKKLLSYLVIIMMTFGISSCSNTEEPNVPQRAELNYKISPEEAIEIVNDFLSAQESASKSRSIIDNNNRTVTKVEAIRKGITSRSTDEVSMSTELDTLMYAINFDNEKGFAIVAADRRTQPMIALIESGAFSLDSLKEDEDEGFLSFIEDAIQMEINDINEYAENPSSRALVLNNYSISSYIAPILHTKWTQGDVYGKYCPNKIAGCAIIATAQILSHFKTVGQVNWSYNGIGGSAILHWNQIISDCDNHHGKLTTSDCSASGNEIAHLVRYLGIALGADYKKNSTGCGESKAIDWFNKYGNLNASKLKDYNETAIVNSIKSGNPVYARGNSGKKKVLGIRVGWKGGHAWVYDGMLVASKNGKTNTFIHCNWGWGGRNDGYYISKAFDTNAGAIIYDNSDEYQIGGTSNYRYHLQYSIINRK